MKRLGSASRRAAFILVPALIVLLGACADQGKAAIAPDPDGGFVLPTATYATDIAPLIAKYDCYGCHMTTSWDGVESLSAMNAKAIVTYLTTTHSEECPTSTYVVAGEPDLSYLYQKVIGTGSCYTGAPMPLGSGPLPAADASVLHDWIAGGALVE